MHLTPERTTPAAMGPRDIEEAAGVPTTAPDVLSASEVKRVLNWDRVQLDRLERTQTLLPLPNRRLGQHRQYWTTDVATVIVERNLSPNWEALNE